VGTVLLFPACGEAGESGEAPLDCGPGTYHDGHCHCDEGYLFDGATCVDPSEITEICEEHEADTDAEEEEHSHAACLCPEPPEECPCDHGGIESFGGSDYCVPELHED
jgi:hypothetical protein